ncbi:MAG TPA: sugar ABC transporter permease [Candidatus Limnocylindrales bacterium]|nr:sugar ABC transporter permease [Candidatus Limnocylindrales bacterium]
MAEIEGKLYKVYTKKYKPGSRLWTQGLENEWLLGYLLLFPIFVILVGLIGYPFISTIIFSFQNKLIGVKESEWVGLDNYRYLLHNPIFLKTVVNSFVYTILGVGIKCLLGLTTATVLNQPIRFRNFFRTLLFAPWAIPAVMTALNFRWIYDDMNGVLNLMLVRYLGRKEFIYFLSDPKIVMFSVVAVVVWQGTPFYSMNFLAGMQAVPMELYEAAEIDGASAIQKFFYITIPSIRHVIAITVLLSTIWTANEVQFVYILTNGGPDYATQIFPNLALELFQGQHLLGRAVAVTLIFFPLFLVAIAFLTRKMLRQTEL